MASDPIRVPESLRLTSERLHASVGAAKRLDHISAQFSRIRLPAEWARISEQVAKVVSTDDLGCRISQQVALAQASGTLPRLAEQWARIDADHLERITAQTTPHLRAVGEQVRRAFEPAMTRAAGRRVAVDWPALEVATIQFEDAARDADDAGPRPEVSASLGWWLASRTVRSQLELLIAALAALEAIGGFIEELTGEGVPPAVRAGTAMVVAVAAFLLVWLDHESPRAEVEQSEGT
jgi:hypothetical protein